MLTHSNQYMQLFCVYTQMVSVWIYVQTAKAFLRTLKINKTDKQQQQKNLSLTWPSLQLCAVFCVHDSFITGFKSLAAIPSYSHPKFLAARTFKLTDSLSLS